MTLCHATRAEIRRLFYAEHFTMNAIAEALGVHHGTVKHVLHGQNRGRGSRGGRRNIEPYVPFIEKALETYPKLRATRIKQMIGARGYEGSVRSVRRLLKELRPRFMKAYLPMSVIPGEQAQVDWAHFGQMPVENTRRKLYCFLIILAHSRALYAYFTFDMKMPTFLRCHVQGFHYLGGIARQILYDNLKSVVVEREGPDIKFNPQHLEFSGHYHFSAVACNPRAGWEKGRIERAVRYIRESFFYGRSFKNIHHLNQQLRRWLDEEANCRPWADDTTQKVVDVWREEKARLLALPGEDFPTDDIQTLSSGKMPFIRYDTNDYSIPYQYVRKPLQVLANETTVRILDYETELARHARSYGRRVRIRCDDHFAGLLEERRRAKTRCRRSELIQAIPELEELYLQSEGLGRAGVVTKKLSSFATEYGTESLRQAVRDCLDNGCVQLPALARILAENAQKNIESQQIGIVLPNKPHIAELTVATPDLATYDDL